MKDAPHQLTDLSRRSAAAERRSGSGHSVFDHSCRFAGCQHCYCVSCLLVVFLLAGCQSAPRVALGTTAATAGSITANKASGGNPYWTAAGGLAGYFIADAVQGAQDKTQQQALALAYERGRAQSAQQTYDILQNTQKTDRPGATNDAKSYAEIPIVVPKRSINGVILNESVEYVRLSTK